MQIMGRRYIVGDMLGEGAMGSVWRVYDRLAGGDVALKLVNPEGGLWVSTLIGEGSDTIDTLLALTQEFKTLARLRHPHIISVLDYGFDADQQPFFTMELVENAQPLIRYAKGLMHREQVKLMLQLYQALIYLHRHGILHRDLKPENVLIGSNKVLKLLDFGLASGVVDAHGTIGTLAYMAPEVLSSGQHTVRSDLYATGVIAYELFTGLHPYRADSMATLVENALHQAPNMALIEPNLAKVVGRLLAKDPAERYGSAEEALHALADAAKLPVPKESAAMREGFLQTAPLVGRESELNQLITGMRQVQHGVGSAWLLAGESGVGKSRLLDELRIHALVDRMIVLFGQGAQNGQTYHFWREPLRRLALYTDLTDLEAGIFRPLVPDIDDLVERVVPPVQDLTGRSDQDRLAQTIIDVLRRLAAEQPILMIFEDLHFASESLEILKTVCAAIADLPIFIIGSYRDDEKPDLPTLLPQMQGIKVNRFKDDTIATITHSILGQVGQNPEVVSYLQRQTQGNAFFLIETIRDLAKDVNRLDEIGYRTLPILAGSGGIRKVIQRRLKQIPANIYSLLELAAVAGRQLDLTMLSSLITPDIPEDWLATCNNIAVLEVVDQHWQFVHDRIVDALLENIAAERRPELHSTIARAIENTYPDDPSRAAILAEHWRQAGDKVRYTHYARTATQAALRVSDYSAARRLASALIEDTDVEALNLLGDVYEALGEYAKAESFYQQMQTRATAENRDSMLVAALNGQSRVNWRRGRYTESRFAAEQALGLARGASDLTGIATTLTNLAIICGDQGRFPEARVYLTECLNIRRTLNDQPSVVFTTNSAGIIAHDAGDHESALRFFLEGLAGARQLGDRHETLFSLYGLSGVTASQGNYQASFDYALDCYKIAETTLDRRGLALAALSLGIALGGLGQFDQATARLEEAINDFEELGDRRQVALAFFELGRLYMLHGEYAKAEEYGLQSLFIRREIAEQSSIPLSLGTLGLLESLRGNPDKADTYHVESVTAARLHNNNFILSLALGTQACSALVVGNLELARPALVEALNLVTTCEATTVKLLTVLGCAGIVYMTGDRALADSLVEAILNQPGFAHLHIQSVSLLITQVAGQLPQTASTPGEGLSQVLSNLATWMTSPSPR
jgi:tetratricopeptide (TPR) repeat protein